MAWVCAILVGAQWPVSRKDGRYCRQGRDSLGLRNGFEVGKEEGPVLENRPPDRPAKLVAFEWRNFGAVKIVSSVQSAVAQKLVSIPVKSIRPGARNCIDNAAGSFAVFCRIITRYYGKFLDGIYTQASTQHAARSTIGVIIKANAVQTVVVLLRTATGDSQLLSETTIAAICANCERGLGLNGNNAGLEGREVGPAASVQRQLTNSCSVNHGADVGSGQLHRGRFRPDLNLFRAPPYFHPHVQTLVCPDGQGNVGYGCHKSASHDGDPILPRH